MMPSRSSGGLSKPNCASSCLMKAGSRPCAPRYLDEASPSPPPGWLCAAPEKSPPVPPEIRGTVMGLSGTSAAVGWIGAAGLGAAMIGLGGFDWFGPLGLVLGLACAASALWCRKNTI